MKKFVVICVMLAVIFLIGASFFVFNEEVIDVYERGIKLVVDSDSGRGAGGGFDSKGGEDESGSGGGSSSEGGESLTCEMRQVQYSLKNFVNDVRCLDGTEEECFDLIGNCSVDVHNFDGGIGYFAIKYYLINSNENRLDSKLIQKEVLVNNPETFSVIFTRTDVGGFDGDLSCAFTMESIPMKEYCN